MKMSLTAILISLALSFGGGYYVGTTKQKARSDVLIEQSKLEIDKVSIKLDSLRNVPAQLDSVTSLLISSRAELSNVSLKLDSLQKLPKKVDTLILVNKDIYLNTDTIKKELRHFIRENKRAK